MIYGDGIEANGVTMNHDRETLVMMLFCWMVEMKLCKMYLKSASNEECKLLES